MPKSPAASLSPLDKSEYIDRVKAFIFSGRLKLRVSTRPSCVVKISLIRASYGVTRVNKKSTMGTRGEADIYMARDITISTRVLTTFEQLVLELV